MPLVTNGGDSAPAPFTLNGHGRRIVERTISHYRVLHPLGGMGEVYAGIDETLKRRVALKAIRAEHRLSPVCPGGRDVE